MHKSELVKLGFKVKENGKIDFDAPPKGKRFIPIPVDEEYIKDAEIDKSFVTLHRFSATTRKVHMVLVEESEEKISLSYVNDIKAEYKKEERRHRCKIKSPKTGKEIYCPDCISCYGDDCPKKHGLMISDEGDKCYEDIAYSVRSCVYSDDPSADEAVTNVMWDDFKKQTKKKNPVWADIIQWQEEGYSRDEILERCHKAATNTSWYYDQWSHIKKAWKEYNR